MKASFHVRPSSLSSREFTIVRVTAFLPFAFAANSLRKPQDISRSEPSGMTTGAVIVRADQAGLRNLQEPVDHLRLDMFRKTPAPLPKLVCRAHVSWNLRGKTTPASIPPSLSCPPPGLHPVYSRNWKNSFPVPIGATWLPRSR